MTGKSKLRQLAESLEQLQASLDEVGPTKLANREAKRKLFAPENAKRLKTFQDIQAARKAAVADARKQRTAELAARLAAQHAASTPTPHRRETDTPVFRQRPVGAKVPEPVESVEARLSTLAEALEVLQDFATALRK